MTIPEARELREELERVLAHVEVRLDRHLGARAGAAQDLPLLMSAAANERNLGEVSLG